MIITHTKRIKLGITENLERQNTIIFWVRRGIEAEWGLERTYKLQTQLN